MGGNMVSPDVEMVHDETGHIYFMGRVYDVTRMSHGWVLTRANGSANLEHIYVGASVEECCTWLVAQLTY